jgi:hypothetical protein
LYSLRELYHRENNVGEEIGEADLNRFGTPKPCLDLTVFQIEGASGRNQPCVLLTTKH